MKSVVIRNMIASAIAAASTDASASCGDSTVSIYRFRLVRDAPEKKSLQKLWLGALLTVVHTRSEHLRCGCITPHYQQINMCE